MEAESTPSQPANDAGGVASAEMRWRAEHYFLVGGLLLLLLSLMIKSAWLGDDFYIGARSYDNLLHGYGLRWNVQERVQVFTDPLWSLILIALYAVTNNIFVTVLLLSIVTSALAVILLARSASSGPAAAAAVAVLLSSRSFLDYTTSGLENPLSYLLCVAFVWLFCARAVTRQQWRLLVLVSALVGFNRLDLMLMLFPAMLYVAWMVLVRHKLSLASFIADGALYSLPLSGWLVFSTIYFGYPFPNTYYAKLYTGIPRTEQWIQGLLYYVSAINFDPLALLVTILAIGALWATRDARLIAGAVGVVLYLLYIVKIGGDFMNGRFLSVPLLFVIALLVRVQLRNATWLSFGLMAVLLGLLAPKPTLFYNESFWVPVEHLADRRGVADERATYFYAAGLLTNLRHDNFEPDHGWVRWGRWGREARRQGRQIVVFGTPGMYAYYAGPEVHVVDYYALGDPLLSKLPIPPGGWRVGHYPRRIPNGYIESIQTGENRIEDPAIRELYRATKILAEAPLWSVERFKEIAKMNLGFYKRQMRAAAKSTKMTDAAVGGLQAYPWPERGPTARRRAVGATIRSTWNRESDGLIDFWWTNKDARLEFVVPDGIDADRPMVVPVQPYGRDVRLEFVVNGTPVDAESLRSTADSPFIPMVIRGPWKSGANVIEVIGSGEPVKPGGADPRQLLFAVREPSWQ